MKLCIDIAARDVRSATVNSITDTTPIGSPETLVLGDSEPLDITFTDSSVSPSASPAWAGDATYTPSVSFGTLDANGLLNYIGEPVFTPQTGGWTGRMSLAGDGLRNAFIIGTQTGGGWQNIATDPRTRNLRPRQAYFWLQVRVTAPVAVGWAKTFALLYIRVLNRG
jgi:hypothetical protein